LFRIKNHYNYYSLLNINNATVAGDTRFDRVSEIAENFTPIEEIEKFCSDSSVLVAGSTWPQDENLIKIHDSPTFPI
jgi:hypothetical protein